MEYIQSQVQNNYVKGAQSRLSGCISCNNNDGRIVVTTQVLFGGNSMNKTSNKEGKKKEERSKYDH